jgi:exodeoxyribonuclease VII large subunit
VQRPFASRRGHLYFELVEKGDGDRIVGKLGAVIWRTDHQRVRRRLAEVGQEIADGQEIRCFGRLDFYGPAGRLQLIVQEVDPLFTLGMLEKRRRETLAALERAGLLERNKALALPAVPLRVGLVTSGESAAYHDFLAGLTASGYGFRVLFVHAAVQGPAAEVEIPSAIDALGRVSIAGAPLDCVVLTRGGGSRTDLAAFDSRAVAEAVARCPLPVLTGLGHEIDRSIADLVSHSAVKTPSAAAELLVDLVGAAELRLTSCADGLGRAAREAVRRARDELRRFDRLPHAAGVRLGDSRRSVADVARALDLLSRRRLREAGHAEAEIRHRLGTAAPRLLARLRRRPDQLARRLADVAAGRLREASAVLAGLDRLCHELAPERVLERGYSITRSAAGTIVRSPGQIRSGEVITTRVTGGTFASRVEAARGAAASEAAAKAAAEEA